MQNSIDIERRRHRFIGWLVSILIHLLLLLIFFAPYFKEVPEEKPIAGILVSFGDVDSGLESETDTQSEILEKNQSNSESSAEEAEVSQASEQDDQSENPKEKEAKPNEAKVNLDLSDLSNSDSKKEDAAKQADLDEAERKRREAKEIANKEAQRKAEEEQKKAEFEAKKKKFGNLFGKGSGSGGSEGNEGIPEGDPNSKVLDDLSVGSGNIGGGLSNRGLLFEPKISDSSQKTGKVVMDVCVNQKGEVIEARWTQKGSTTTDSQLKEIAIKAAYKYKFTAAQADRQCGTITVNFEVQ